ncbi:hypothetical protein PYCCODRAFT_179189 [Trametes coccinea BRFM310]|uniref:Uncharacterized protein n=1 Tax=Trametes coccinea (strain BRFM310) TaxID=1353009 RepID=A0A1Y2IV91_TRAC3|nr:hypothetical protein PYCCODRAFT_179189 [Trametes coccinea BRFM310]
MSELARSRLSRWRLPLALVTHSGRFDAKPRSFRHKRRLYMACGRVRSTVVHGPDGRFLQPHFRGTQHLWRRHRASCKTQPNARLSLDPSTPSTRAERLVLCAGRADGKMVGAFVAQGLSENGLLRGTIGSAGLHGTFCGAGLFGRRRSKACV